MISHNAHITNIYGFGLLYSFFATKLVFTLFKLLYIFLALNLCWTVIFYSKIWYKFTSTFIPKTCSVWDLWNCAFEATNIFEEQKKSNNKRCITKQEPLCKFHFPLKGLVFSEALSPAFIHGAADLWSHPLAYGATAEQQLQLHQQALLHPALQQQLPVRSFL